MENIVVFAQAPADIQHVLAIYDKYKNKTKLLVFVVNVGGMYKFLLSLNLKLHQLIFIPYVQNLFVFNPLSIQAERKRLISLYRKYFKEIKGAEIYFFSIYFDWIVYSFIAKLSYYNIIYLIDYCELERRRIKHVSNLKLRLFSLVFRYITGVKMSYYLFPGNKFPLRLPAEKYRIKRLKPYVLSGGLYHSYGYNLDNVKEPAILFFDKYLPEGGFIIGYEKKITEIFEFLMQCKINIYLKPHPRMGYLKSLERFCSNIVPDFVPGEFINTEPFQAIIGIYSTSLNWHAQKGSKPTYSLMNLFNFSNEGDKYLLLTQNIRASNGQLKYINSLNDLKNILQ